MAALQGMFTSPETYKAAQQEKKEFGEKKASVVDDLRAKKTTLTESRDNGKIVRQDYDRAMKLLDTYLAAATAATTQDKLDKAVQPLLDNPNETNQQLLELRGQGYAILKTQMDVLTGRDEVNTQAREALTSDQIKKISSTSEELENWLKDNTKATEILIKKELDWYKDGIQAIMNKEDVPPAPETETATSVEEQIKEIPPGAATEVAFEIIGWLNFGLGLLMIAIAIFMSYMILGYRPAWYRFFWAAANSFWIWIIYRIFPFAGFFFIAPFLWLIYHIISGIKTPNRAVYIQSMYDNYIAAREAKLT